MICAVPGADVDAFHFLAGFDYNQTRAEVQYVQMLLLHVGVFERQNESGFGFDAFALTDWSPVEIDTMIKGQHHNGGHDNGEQAFLHPDEINRLQDTLT